MTRHTAATAAVGAFAAVVLAIAGWIALPLPHDLRDPGAAPSLELRDRHGLLLRATRTEDGLRGGWVPLAEMDPQILQAFVAVEDHRFREHPGVDARALARALWDNLRSARIVSGGSTITMQVARLLRPTPRTWLGKVRQALWALRLEAHLEKPEILEAYLNQVPLGQGAVGVSAAAALYFDASARRLSLGQAALLAGLARAPSSDNPLVAPERARARRRVVLQRLLELGFARAEDVRRAESEPIRAAEPPATFLAPHFTTWWIQQAESARRASQSGVHRTSLDLPLQAALEAEVRYTVTLLGEHRAREAALVALDNHTGEILAWIGSPDFWADTAGQVDMVTSPRQPGSALKPFLYALAFDRGYTAASILPDIPRTYVTTIGPYRPRNYDRQFHGPVRAREAVGSSFNVPAVELAERLGPSPFLRTLQRAGFASLDRGPDHYGLGLALGNGEVTLLELANAYRALANGGVYRPIRREAVAPAEAAITPAAGARVASAAAAALVLDILSDPVARVPGFGASTPLDFPFPAAAKTGTSRHFTDNWAVGVTGRFTVAVWVGNFSGRPMDGVSGISGAAPLLRRAMLVTAGRYPPGALPTPQEAGLVPGRICLLSGKLAHDGCPHGTEWFFPGSVPTETCDWHRDGGVQLPAEYAEWQGQHGAEVRFVTASEGTETELSSGADARLEAAPRFRIVSPQDGDRYERPPGIDPAYATVALRAVGADGPVRWFIDGRETRASRWSIMPGTHVIGARSALGEWDEVKVVIRETWPGGPGNRSGRAASRPGAPR